MLIGADRISVQPIQNWQPATGGAGQALSAGAIVKPIRYHNPVFSIDSSGVVVVQVRDTETGEIKQQFPSEKALKAYRQQAMAGPVPLREVNAAEPAVAAPAEAAVANSAHANGPSPETAQTDTLAGLRLDV